MAKKTNKKKAPRSSVGKDEDWTAPVSKAPVKKASKKVDKKDDGRPAGAPPADHCDAEWETDTHHIYKLKFEHVGEDNQRKIKIAK